MPRRVAISLGVVTAMAVPAASHSRPLVLQAPPAVSQAAASRTAEQAPSSSAGGVQTPVPPTPAPATPQPSAPQPPAAPATPPTGATQGRGPALAFAAEAGMVLSPIIPAQTAVFEEVMQKVREGLEKSTDPVRAQQAAGWTIYKGTDAYQGNTLYISVMDPAVKGADYSVFELLLETMTDAEARAMFEQFRNAFGGAQHVVSMSPALSMKPVPNEAKQQR